MNIFLHDEVKADLLSGFRFYEHQDPGLGDYFLDSLWADLESLQIYAGVHIEVFGFFRMLARRFPFAVYYRIVGEEIYKQPVPLFRLERCWVFTINNPP